MKIDYPIFAHKTGIFLKIGRYMVAKGSAVLILVIFRKIYSLNFVERYQSLADIFGILLQLMLRLLYSIFGSLKIHSQISTKFCLRKIKKQN